jgi:hypothetical protein
MYKKQSYFRHQLIIDTTNMPTNLGKQDLGYKKLIQNTEGIFA